MRVEIRAVDEGTLPAALALLAACELPTEDLPNPMVSLIGAFLDGELAGVIGLQRCGEVGLLRSLAVAPSHREHGIARELCERLFEIASAAKIESLFLLTTTAADYFTWHGFARVARDAVPASVRATEQFASLCPASAHVMHLSRVTNSAPRIDPR